MTAVEPTDDDVDRRTPDWFKTAVFYEVLVRVVPRLQRATAPATSGA